MAKNKKLFITIIALLFISFLCYSYFSSKASPRQDIKVVEVDKLTLKDISQTTSLIGTIRAKNATMLTAQGEGVLETIVSSGTQMLKGDIIARIANKEVEKNYELSLESKAIAEEQFKRIKSLKTSKTYSQQDLENAQNTWITAQKNLADSKIALDKLVFYAPFDGLVGSYKAKEGQQLQIAAQVVNFFNPDAITVDFDIPQSILPNINNAQNLSILGKKYQLDYVQKMLDEDKHMSPANVDIECSDCIIGSTIIVDLTVLEKKQVIIVPLEAVFLSEGKSSVYVVENNKAMLRNVELGIKQKELVEITSGLKEGEEVVIRSTNRLSPGVDVQIHQE